MEFLEEFRRKVHLDGHLSPAIGKLAYKFDKNDFQKKLRKGNISCITLFAKCHHGYTYYPSAVGRMHPSLHFDLLGAQIEAAHEIGVKTNIYIPVGWSVYDVEKHPEWRAYDFDTKQVADNGFKAGAKPDESIPEGCWVNLCPTGEYLKYLQDFTREVCERYKPVDGIFYDICFNRSACVCPSCRKGMQEAGLDPENRRDAELYYQRKRLEMQSSLNKIIHDLSPSATVFYNGSAAVKLDDTDYKEYHAYDTHFEIEELPTLDGDYDKACLKSKYFVRYGKPIIGMTGKFQLGWGEFGGYKAKEALLYETSYALSLGIGFCVGDQLHPSGALDGPTYEMIGESFRYYQKYEKICLNTVSAADFGVVLTDSDELNAGINKMLCDLQVDYDVLCETSDFSAYKCILIGGKSAEAEKFSTKINNYLQNGGKLIIVGEGLHSFSVKGLSVSKESVYDVDYLICKEISGSPLVMYHPALRIQSDGFEILAQKIDPYFKRTYEHYCSHMHAPYSEESPVGLAAVFNGQVMALAHDVFSEYYKKGQTYVRIYFEKMLARIYTDRIVGVRGLMSEGRMRIRKDKEGRHYLLHLLYAPVIKRGQAYVIDDEPVLYDVEATVCTAEKIRRAVNLISGEEIPLQEKQGKVCITVPQFRRHCMIALEY